MHADFFFPLHIHRFWCLSAQARLILKIANVALKSGGPKNTKKNHDYFSSAEQKTVYSVEEEFVPLTSGEENQNKKQDQLTQK